MKSVEACVLLFVCVYMCMYMFQHHFLKRILFLLNCLCSFDKDQCDYICMDYFWTLYSIALMYLFSHQYHTVNTVVLFSKPWSLQLCSFSILCWLFCVFLPYILLNHFINIQKIRAKVGIFNSNIIFCKCRDVKNWVLKIVRWD